MGLDMYLYKRHYVKNWDHHTEAERHEVTVKKGGEVLTTVNASRISEIVEEVGYWRKANQIHKWFCDNTSFSDNGAEAYVSHEKLAELMDVCDKVVKASKLKKGLINNGYSYNEHGVKTPNTEEGEYIEDATVAMKLLPTESGFFFGGTDYDQWYLDDVKETHAMLESLLKEEGAERASYYYSANW